MIIIIILFTYLATVSLLSFGQYRARLSNALRSVK
jgi:hypothetical protein